MKTIVFSLLAYVVALEAMPQPYLGFNNLGASDFGNGYGDGMYGYGGRGYGIGGVGLGNRFLNRLGLGGYGGGGISSGSGYTQGNGYGSNQYNSGATGMANEAMHNGGASNFHDIGNHHNSLTSITQAENTDNHDIGGGQAFDTGALSGNGFNQFANGGSQFGNGYGSGQQMMSSYL